jgi:hypothetical protein
LLTLVHVPDAGRAAGGRAIMKDMATDQHQPPVAESQPESVVEFGVEPSAKRPGRSRWNAAGVAAAVAGDRRTVPLLAILAGLALFASLVSEWQVTAISATLLGGETDTGYRSVPTDVGGLGAWGGGYLAGLFLLVGATVLAMFGPPAGARYARLAGLSTGGVLIAMLAALTSILGDTSMINGVFVGLVGEDQIRPSYGRGIWCALFGVAAAMLALHLAGRHDRLESPGWSWRREPGAAAEQDDDERPPAEPFELTVGPATPFTSLPDDRDNGISG